MNIYFIVGINFTLVFNSSHIVLNAKLYKLSFEWVFEFDLNFDFDDSEFHIPVRIIGIYTRYQDRRCLVLQTGKCVL